MGICIPMVPGVTYAASHHGGEARNMRGRIMHKPAIHPDVIRRATEAPRRVCACSTASSQAYCPYRGRSAERLHGARPGRRDRHGARDRAERQPDQCGGARRPAGSSSISRTPSTRSPSRPGRPSSSISARPERRERMIETFSPGAFGHALWPGLDVLPQDLQGAEAPVRRLRARRVRPARDPAGARHRYADHHRHRDAGLLRVRPRATR